MSKIEIIYLTPQQPETVYLKSEEPTVFEVLDETVEQPIQLKPQVKIHSPTKKENKTPTKPKETNKPRRKHKNLKRASVFFISIFVIGILLFNLGYLPIKAFLNTPEPIACAGEVNVKQYMDQYPALKNIPKLNDIKYKVYVSDASLESVEDNYIYKLKKQGYSLDYQGEVTKNDITFHYLGFTKGITGIGIILSDDVQDIFNHETAVLSTIGSIYDYQEIITWYKDIQYN